MKGLGRLYVEDPRDEAYPLRAAIPATAPARTHRYWWSNGLWVDQGNTGTCVGAALAHYIADGPVTYRGKLNHYDIYREAVLLDAWSGNDREATLRDDQLQFGTSVRAGAKVLQRRGHIAEYRWGRTLADLVDALLYVGPVVLGTTWYEGMTNPGDDHIARPTGAVQGGHAYEANGVNVNRGLVRCKQSWGRHRYGKDGYFWITFDDLERVLLPDYAEIMLATENKL